MSPQPLHEIPHGLARHGDPCVVVGRLHPVVGLGQLLAPRRLEGAFPDPEESGQGVLPRQVIPADALGDVGRHGEGAACGMRGERAADAGGPGQGKVFPHALQDVLQGLAGDISEGKGHEVAGAQLAAAVDVEMRQSRAAAEGVPALQVGEGRKDREVIAAGDLPLVIPDELPPGIRQGHVLAAGKAPRRAGLQEVDFQGPRFFHETHEGHEALPLEKIAGPDGYDVRVQAGLPGRLQALQGDIEGVFSAAHPVVLASIGAVEADADGEDAARAKLPGPFFCELPARGAHGDARSIVEAPADLGEVVSQQGLAAGQGDDDGAQVLELRGEPLQGGKRDVLGAPAGVVAVPAAEGAAVGDGEGHRVEPPAVVAQEMIGHVVEGPAGPGRELGVDDPMLAEGDGLLALQIGFQEIGHLRVKFRQGRVRRHLEEEIVAAHRILEKKTKTFRSRYDRNIG